MVVAIFCLCHGKSDVAVRVRVRARVRRENDVFDTAIVVVVNVVVVKVDSVVVAVDSVVLTTIHVKLVAFRAPHFAGAVPRVTASHACLSVTIGTSSLLSLLLSFVTVDVHLIDGHAFSDMIEAVAEVGASAFIGCPDTPHAVRPEADKTANLGTVKSIFHLQIVGAIPLEAVSTTDLQAVSTTDFEAVSTTDIQAVSTTRFEAVSGCVGAAIFGCRLTQAGIGSIQSEQTDGKAERQIVHRPHRGGIRSTHDGTGLVAVGKGRRVSSNVMVLK